MIWDMEALPLSITNINTIVLQLEKSGDKLTVKNMTRADLETIKEALVLYGKIDFIFEEMNKSIQASTDLILEMVKDKKGIVEVVLDKIDQFKNNQQIEKESPDAMAKNFRRKI